MMKVKDHSRRPQMLISLDGTLVATLASLVDTTLAAVVGNRYYRTSTTTSKGFSEERDSNVLSS